MGGSIEVFLQKRHVGKDGARQALDDEIENISDPAYFGDLFQDEDASRIVRETRDIIHASSTAQIPQNQPRTTSSAHKTRAVTSEFFTVIQAHTLDSKRRWFSTGSAQTSESDKQARAKSTEKRKLPPISGSRRWDMHTCERALAAQMPVDTLTRRKLSP